MEKTENLKGEDLKEKVNLKDKVEDLTGHLRDFADTYYKLTVLKVAQKATNAGAGALVGITLATLGVLVLLFASIGAAFWLGDLMNSRAGGFLAMAGFYLLMVLFIIMLRKRIIFPYIRNSIIRKIYE